MRSPLIKQASLLHTLLLDHKAVSLLGLHQRVNMYYILRKPNPWFYAGHCWGFSLVFPLCGTLSTPTQAWLNQKPLSNIYPTSHFASCLCRFSKWSFVNKSDLYSFSFDHVWDLRIFLRAHIAAAQGVIAAVCFQDCAPWHIFICLLGQVPYIQHHSAQQTTSAYHLCCSPWGCGDKVKWNLSFIFRFSSVQDRIMK